MSRQGDNSSSGALLYTCVADQPPRTTSGLVGFQTTRVFAAHMSKRPPGHPLLPLYRPSREKEQHTVSRATTYATRVFHARLPSNDAL